MSTDSFTGDSEPVSANASSVAARPKRYHPALVALHWLIAILIFGAFFLAQSNEGGRERFEGGRENLPQQEFRSGNLPPEGSEP